MKSYPRSEKVQGLILEQLGELLKRRVSDPRLSLATITGVSVSRDLRLAKVYYSCTPTPEAQKKTSLAFEGAKGFIKRELAKTLGLRYMPEFQFLYDEALDRGHRVNDLLKEIHPASDQPEDGCQAPEDLPRDQED